MPVPNTLTPILRQHAHSCHTRTAAGPQLCSHPQRSNRRGAQAGPGGPDEGGAIQQAQGWGHLRVSAGCAPGLAQHGGTPAAAACSPRGAHGGCRCGSSRRHARRCRGAQACRSRRSRHGSTRRRTRQQCSPWPRAHRGRWTRRCRWGPCCSSHAPAGHCIWGPHGPAAAGRHARTAAWACARRRGTCACGACTCGTCTSTCAHPGAWPGHVLELNAYAMLLARCMNGPHAMVRCSVARKAMRTALGIRGPQAQQDQASTYPHHYCPATQVPEPSADALEQLGSMGFPEPVVRKVRAAWRLGCQLGFDASMGCSNQAALTDMAGLVWTGPDGKCACTQPS